MQKWTGQVRDERPRATSPAHRPPNDLAKAKAHRRSTMKSRLRAKSAVTYDGRAVAFRPTEATKAEACYVRDTSKTVEFSL